MRRAIRIEPAAWRSGPWANGGGTTHTIATWSDGAGQRLARLSVADIDRAGPFSRFPGHQRWLAVLGGGLHLDCAGVPHHLATGAALAFAGDDPVTITTTPAAPARVLNLIIRRGVPWRVDALARASASGFLIVFDLATCTTSIHTGPPPTDIPAPARVAWLGHPIDGMMFLDGAT